MGEVKQRLRRGLLSHCPLYAIRLAGSRDPVTEICLLADSRALARHCSDHRATILHAFIARQKAVHVREEEQAYKFEPKLKRDTQ